MKKCAIVTGAASGIGASVAERFCEEGHHVVMADMNDEQGKRVGDKIGALFFKADLSHPTACKKLIEAAIETYGRIDILVNNAGFQHVSPLEDFPEKQWDLMLKVMLTAPFLLTKYAWPHMKKQNWGRVVNMASIHGMVASPNKIGYISAKHGLIGLTKVVALEAAGRGVTCNAICPGWVLTPLIQRQIDIRAAEKDLTAEEATVDLLAEKQPSRQFATPEQVGGLAAFLCTPAADQITGQELGIDGGWTAQ